MKNLMERKIIEISLNHIPKEEYQKFDMVMNSTKSIQYCFVASIYDEGAIIFNGNSNNIGSHLIENTKRDFPNLFAILEICKTKNIEYIDFFNHGDTYDDFILFKWDTDNP